MLFKILSRLLRTAVWAGAVIAAVAGPAAAQTRPPQGADSARAPALGLPLVCRPGETCWLINYVDVDPGKEARDYRCEGHTYNGHTGVDFAIRDFSKMDDGVPVIAAAAGTVSRTRDGMLDGNADHVGHAAVTDRGCGNFVAVDHGGGWATYYCHLRRGSLVVDRGQRVEKGDRLALVGSSGLSEHPHVHLGVRKGKTFLDPFIGQARRADCGPGPAPLWDGPTYQMLQDRALKGAPTALYDAGFAQVKINPVALRRGFYRQTRLPGKAPALVFWADAFWVHKGDRLTLTITAPDGRVLVDKSDTLKKTQAQYMRFVGKRRRDAAWAPGTYTGEAVLERGGANGRTETFRITRTLTIE